MRSIENVQMHFLMPFKTQDMVPKKSSTKIECPLVEHANEIILDSTFHKEPEISLSIQGLKA